MSRMKRKQIYLEAEQDRRLGALSRRQGKTVSQLIREGVNRMLNEPQQLSFEHLDHESWDEELAFIERRTHAAREAGPVGESYRVDFADRPRDRPRLCGI